MVTSAFIFFISHHPFRFLTIEHNAPDEGKDTRDLFSEPLNSSNYLIDILSGNPKAEILLAGSANSSLRATAKSGDSTIYKEVLRAAKRDRSGGRNRRC